MSFAFLLVLCLLTPLIQPQLVDRKVGKLQEVFAWKQITFNINGILVDQDREKEIKDQEENVVEQDEDQITFKETLTDSRIWNRSPVGSSPQWTSWNQRPNAWEIEAANRPITSTNTTSSGRGFFIQYNNVPMGAEKVGDRLFITIPRRRYGIPSTLNYIDLARSSKERSPSLKPYPSFRASRPLVSVYRTRADECNRLWMVDTGLLEIPNSPQQVQPPAIVVFNLGTDRQILRYQLKSSDVPAANTPSGLASITVDIQGDCSDAFAYIPDLATFGLIVYSLRDNDSWRLSHNFFHFNPTTGNFNIAGQRFQWNDGIFSIALSQKSGDCKIAYFHPLVSTQEFAVSTCTLKNRSISGDSNYWDQYSVLGDRGISSQSTMHDFHGPTRVVFFAEAGRDAVTCWHSGKLLSPANVAVLARDNTRLSYTCDLHVTGDEVWVMANTLPRFIYSTLDTTQYNFYVYRANIRDLIAGTVCDRFFTG